MRYHSLNSSSATGAKRVLSCLLLSSVLVIALTTPVTHENELRIRGADATKILNAESLHVVRSEKDEEEGEPYNIVAHATVIESRATKKAVKPVKAKPKKVKAKKPTTTKAKKPTAAKAKKPTTTKTKKPTTAKAKKPAKTKAKSKSKAKAPAGESCAFIPGGKKKSGKLAARAPPPCGEEELWKLPVPSQQEITKIAKVPKDTALFWSQTATEKSEYRNKAGKTTDSTAYPAGYTKRYRKPAGGYYDKKKDDLFAERFSVGFATKANGIVEIMVPWATGPTPTRYFHQFEWPIIKEGLKTGRITKVVQVNPKNFAEKREYDPKRWGLSKRDLFRRAAEIDLDNAQWDEDLDALYERWQQVHGKSNE